MLRYEEFSNIFKDRINANRYATMYYPKFEVRASDKYMITKRSDRLDLIANDEYGDPRYWVIIARANNLNNATLHPPVGIQLRIPYPLDVFDINDKFTERQF